MITPSDWCPSKKRKLGCTDTGGAHTQRKGRMTANCKTRRENSEETKPADTFILEF